MYGAVLGSILLNVCNYSTTNTIPKSVKVLLNRKNDIIWCDRHFVTPCYNKVFTYVLIQ